MSKPVLSEHFKKRAPSDVRLGQMKFAERKEKPALINVAIGNVSLPTNPAMQKRMFALDSPESPFSKGVIRYSGTAGTDEAQDAFKNILKCQGFDTEKIFVQVTDGGSSAMEMLLLGVCGPAGTDEKPLLMIDPAYTNYISFAERIGRKTVTVKRSLAEDGNFSLPKIDEIEETIKKYNPGALLIIPYDNPTGQLYDYETLKDLAGLCVKYNMWMVSDEAYRELYYSKSEKLVSIWGLSDKDVPGIEGRRISLETASKVWNACGLRIGALITDSKEFHTQAVAEYTANLCSNVIGQYIFGALAHESKESINNWCKGLRDYYKEIMFKLHKGLKEADPNLIVSNPAASIYTVVDVKNIVKPGFDAIDFVMYCAQKGSVDYNGVETTLLVAPLEGFYDIKGEPNPGDTQMRLALIESPENMEKVPELFIKLLRAYEKTR
ncbi:aminotransferase class I/II-fold pyridoxal phosphate-dependent enzyme [Clostridium fermenticellae]|uniref:Aminotransferase class I/II-fold pyridoxal phosphate-dependent enzyme n=1 Tax=Clostridium fermenticellae TaxID=2068654 RepID=A0A386H5M7_9CLOT|nr:aminotransferase class I/II-fold pyridoxal phosphate-dependent enzyme [Clostridium fermenticellae]AYD41051.1 aminotransferase class I/II-fold pyridoxal phosphate-dependent enzyme [Clostridium fermenticellae]